MDTTALLTDRYELTMVEAALLSGAAERPSVFEVFARHLPAGRRYGVVAGTGRLLDALADFRFSADDLAFLEANGVVNARTLEWLAGYRFTGDVYGYREGDVYFPGSPILVVEGTFAEAVLLETLVLAILNHDSAIAAAASRMVQHAEGRPIIEMGTRRTHEISALASARAAYLTGFASTSNLAAGARYGLPTAGTAAHAFTLVHDSEREAFQAQLDALGPGTTLLVDTYDVEAAVREAVALAGPKLGAVRIDSGDLAASAHDVRRQLDKLGAENTRIVVTGDLDDHSIAALSAAPVDGYGVGTSLVTGAGAPTAALVYKLVARSGTAVSKRSVGKPSIGGRKHAHRFYSGGTAAAEVVTREPGPPDADAVRLALNGGSAGGGDLRPLLVPLVRDGEIIGREPLGDARERHLETVAGLPPKALGLSRGDPILPTVFL